MASRPKEARVLAVLGQLATEELGDGAMALEWILDRLESGKTFVKIAVEIGEKLGLDWQGPGTQSGPWTPSRAWVSFIAHRMAWDADQRIAEARRKGAAALRQDGLRQLEPMPAEVAAGDHDAARARCGPRELTFDDPLDESALYPGRALSGGAAAGQ